MAHIVCNCGHFFHPKKNGVLVEEGMPGTSRALSQTDAPSKRGWSPYKLWLADELECRNCGNVIIAGFGMNPLAEHYMPDYEAVRNAQGPVRIFVDDCP